MYVCVEVSILHYSTSPIGFEAVLTVWYFVFILLSIRYNKHILFTGTVTIIIDDESGARFGDFGKSNTGYIER